MAFQNDMLVFLGVKCPKVFSNMLSKMPLRNTHYKNDFQ